MPPRTTVSTSSRFTTPAAAIPSAVPTSVNARSAGRAPASASSTSRSSRRDGSSTVKPRRPEQHLLVRVRLQTAAGTTPADVAVRLDRHVAELAAVPTRAAQQPALEHDARADADLARDVDEARPGLGGSMQLGEGGKVGLVVDGQARSGQRDADVRGPSP